MKVKIEIKCDNAAFEDAPEHEVARILREAAQRIEGGGLSCFPLFDYNGNKVGSVT